LTRKPAKKKPAAASLRRIRLVVLDVDGVLTDGRVILDEAGTEFRVFDVRDGYGIRKASAEGIVFALISGKDTRVVAHRARELGITEVHQGVKDKLKVFRSILPKYRLAPADVCCVGDDEPDLPILREAGFSAAPRSAVPAVKAAVHYVTAAGGGRGAVREIIELILGSRSPAGRPVRK
jgi:3-deoxy-D-manno-octulosonate 8-phosphate phosphatase (KDO 8-P phosphatase)